MTRRSYNAAQADWWKAHPELVALRQLAGVDQVDTPDESEFSEPDPDEVIDDYAKRRGE